MSKKKTLLWSISLLLISAVTLITVGCNIIEITLPDPAVIILGVLDLTALPVLVYTTVVSIKARK